MHEASEKTNTIMLMFLLTILYQKVEIKHQWTSIAVFKENTEMKILVALLQQLKKLSLGPADYLI